MEFAVITLLLSIPALLVIWTRKTPIPRRIALSILTIAAIAVGIVIAVAIAFEAHANDPVIHDSPGHHDLLPH